MKWPLVKRSKYDKVLIALSDQRCKTKQRDQALAKLGHKLIETKYEFGKTLSDLRLVRFRIDYPHHNDDKIGFTFQMDGALFDGFRHNGPFTEMLAYMIHRYMMQTPEGRKSLAGCW